MRLSVEAAQTSPLFASRRDASLGRTTKRLLFGIPDAGNISTERCIPTECRLRWCVAIPYREIIPMGLFRERQFELKIGVATCTPIAAYAVCEIMPHPLFRKRLCESAKETNFLDFISGKFFIAEVFHLL
jgi:hypothetical protein